MTSRPHFHGVTAGKKIQVFKFGLSVHFCAAEIIRWQLGCLYSLTIFWKLSYYFLPVSKLFILEKNRTQKSFVIQQGLRGPPGTLNEPL